MVKIKFIKIIFLYTLLLVVLFFPAGCTGISTESGMMKNLEGTNMTSIELSIQLNELGRYFSGTVEEAADEIMSSTKNNIVKNNALQWKINVIPEAMESLVILDPVAAGIDLFALSIQMNHFFTTGQGKDLFGDQQYIAIKASENILKEIRRLTDEFRSPEKRAETEQKLQEWARENPIENINFKRRSTLGVLAKALGSQSYTLGETLGSMAEGMYGLRKQITIYTSLEPKYIKWQMQLSANQLVTDSLIEKSLNNIDRIVRSGEEITSVVNETPELLKEIQLSTYVEINKQLIITLNSLAKEREEVLKSLHSEQIAALDNLNKQRIASFDKLEKITNGVITQSSFIADDIVDKIFLRLLVFSIIFFIGAVILLKIWRAKPDTVQSKK